jgi:hypothetical protein
MPRSLPTASLDGACLRFPPTSIECVSERQAGLLRYGGRTWARTKDPLIKSGNTGSYSAASVTVRPPLHDNAERQKTK